MRKKGIQTVVMFMIWMLLTFSGTFSVGAKSVNVKAASYTRSSVLAAETAKKVNTGSVRLKIGTAKYPYGYAVFTAPKNGVYRFYVSDLTTVGAKNKAGRRQIGHVTFMELLKGSFLQEKNAAVVGGVSDSLYLATKEAYAVMKIKKKTADSYEIARGGKIKLKKGQKIYLYFQFTKQMMLTLEIKKL